MRIAFVLGTRPEIIKLAPVILEAKKRRHRTQVIFTGQHREMAGPLLKLFQIQPDLDLRVMRPAQSLTALSARVLEQLDRQADRIRAEAWVVQGDTTSAFMAAYWAFCRKIPVAHVEAGLRTYDLSAPFPEEGNRQLISRIASLHFAPTSQAAQALLREGVPATQIHRVGNTAIDALQWVLRRGKGVRDPHIPQRERIPASISRFLSRTEAESKGRAPLILVTAHRRESFGKAFEGICQGILKTVSARSDLRVIYPVHPNPQVRAPVERMLGKHPRILLCDPLPYFAFVSLMKSADVLLTDSGGIQEEGPTLRKPILVLREKTERPEGVRAGYSRLVGTDPMKIKREALKALEQGCSGRGGNPYGEGKAAARIVSVLEQSL